MLVLRKRLRDPLIQSLILYGAELTIITISSVYVLFQLCITLIPVTLECVIPIVQMGNKGIDR